MPRRTISVAEAKLSLETFVRRSIVVLQDDGGEDLLDDDGKPLMAIRISGDGLGGDGGPGGAAVWGDITGDLADQADLQTRFLDFADAIHGHNVGNITGLQQALDQKANKTYVEYVGTLSQSGTNAPVFTAHRNEFGAVVWTYISEGVYHGTLSGAFPAGKCVGWMGKNDFESLDAAQTQPTVQRIDNNTIQVFSLDGDTCLLGCPIFIQRIP